MINRSLVFIAAFLFVAYGRDVSAACTCYAAIEYRLPDELVIVPTSCTTTPAGHQWLVNAFVDGDGVPKNGLQVAIPNSWYFAADRFWFRYMGEANGLPILRALVTFTMPYPVLDPLPPDREQLTSQCASKTYETTGVGYGPSCYAAESAGQRDAEARANVLAAAFCPSPAICASALSGECIELGWKKLQGVVTKQFSCFATYNLCR